MTTNYSNIKTLQVISGINTPLVEKKRRKVSQEKLVSTWEKTGLLRGLKTFREKLNMAILLKNQAKQVLTEVSNSGLLPGSEEWAGIVLPIVRRTFGNLGITRFVYSQSMTASSGFIFVYKGLFGTNKPGFEKDKEVLGNVKGKYPEGGLYGAGRFNYSMKTYVTKVSTTNGPEQVQGTVKVEIPDTAALKEEFKQEVEYASDLVPEIDRTYTATEPARLKRVTLTISKDGHGSMLRGLDIYGIRGTVIDVVDSNTKQSNAMNLSKEIHRAFTKVTETATQYIIKYYVWDVDNNVIGDANNDLIVPAGNDVLFYWNYQPRGVFAGQVPLRTDFEDRVGGPVDAETDMKIPEFKTAFERIELNVRARKLKTAWTQEFQDDMMNIHQFDVQTESVLFMSSQINNEISLEIYEMLRVSAPSVDYWSAIIGKEMGINSQGQIVSTTLSNASAFNKQTWAQTFVARCRKVSNLIEQKIFYGAANRILVSPQVSTIFEQIPGFTFEKADIGDSMLGIQKVGVFNGLMEVYKNPWQLQSEALLAYQGTSSYEIGGVYCPYIPLESSPVVPDPNNFTPRRVLQTRYAKEMVRKEFYGRVVIVDPEYI